ncbi:MAG: alpha/beta fold hydrolase, partial [Pseudonocardiaceae bacterium]
MGARPAELHASLPSTVLGLGAAAIEGWSGYLAGLCRRRGDVLDVATDFAEFWRVVTSRERPSWAHPNTVDRQRPLADLRDYVLRGERAQVATLVLPPQSGRASSIVDYAEGRSQMLTLRESGLTNLYCLDWKNPGPGTVDASIEDYIALLSETVDYLGGQVNLVGYSQGGWLATIYAALYPDSVHTLVIAGAPIDFHAGRSRVLDWISPLSRRTETASFRSIVAAVVGLQRGISQAVGVPLGKPTGGFERAMGLLAHLDDPRYVERYLELKRWFEWTEDIPAAFSDWIIQQLFVSNRLVSGGLE